MKALSGWVVSMASIAAPVLLMFGLGACMPPPVKTLDDWLSAYREPDRSRLVSLTTSEDQALLKKALQQFDQVPRTPLRRSLPEHPKDHEIIDVVLKEEGRWTISTKLTLRNPLSSTSERVGNQLPNVPPTRPLRRRFLVVESPPGTWGVKLDLTTVLARAELSERVLELIQSKRLQEAEAALNQGIPPIPDNGNGLQRIDRLQLVLESKVEELRKSLTSTRTP